MNTTAHAHPTGLHMTLPPTLAAAARRTTAKAWPQMDTGSTRPGYGLRPERVFAAFRSAEMGAPLSQNDIFEDVIENDGHARGQYLQRFGRVAFADWVVRAGGRDPIDIEAAAALGAGMRSANTLQLLWHLMEGIGAGYSGANTSWGLSVDGHIVPMWFLLAAHRRFNVSNTDDALLWPEERPRLVVAGDESWMGERLTPGDWIEARRPGRKVVRAGLNRTVAWWCLFKRMSVTDWIVFAEKFGLPIALGQYEETASEASRIALLQALIDIGSDGQAVLADTTKIRFESAQLRAGDVSSLHPAIATRCDQEISKLISGGTLTVENGGSGSYGLGQVHERGAVALSRGDAAWIADVIHHGIVRPFLAYNPRFSRAKAPRFIPLVHLEGKLEAETYAILQKTGASLDEQTILDRFGLPTVAPGDALKPYEPPAAASPPPAPVD